MKDYGIRVEDKIHAFENTLYLNILYKGNVVGTKVLVEVK